MKHSQCPSCKSKSIHKFFSIPEAPIQSLVTVKSKEESLKIPTTPIDLSFCSNCGFIFNSSFDTSYDYYTKGYEDQQGFSPTFTKFISEVTTRFIDKYNMRGKMLSKLVAAKEILLLYSASWAIIVESALILRMYPGGWRPIRTSDLYGSFILKNMATSMQIVFVAGIPSNIYLIRIVFLKQSGDRSGKEKM